MNEVMLLMRERLNLLVGLRDLLSLITVEIQWIVRNYEFPIMCSYVIVADFLLRSYTV